MKVGIFLSGKGSNARAILEEAGNKYTVEFLFSDNVNSSATTLGTEFNIPVILLSIESFFKYNNLNLDCTLHRTRYFEEVFKVISPYRVDCIALAGFKWVITDIIWNNYPTLNVHPADLLKVDEDGKRIYVGNNTIRRAIINEEKYVRSTIHLVNGGIDTGQILLQSVPISLIYPDGWKTMPISELIELNRERIKLWGDHIIYPMALNMWAEGMFDKDFIFKLEYNGEGAKNDNN